MFWPLWRWKRTKLLEQNNLMLMEVLDTIRDIREDARAARRVSEELREALTDVGTEDIEPVG